MRLLNSEALEMSVDILNLDRPERPYAVLRHTWGEEEVSFQDFQRPDRVTRKDGIEWAWIDTCCIDKTDSAELLEVINSRYPWYRHPTVCYAYLEEVPPRSPDFPDYQVRNAR